MQLTSSCGQKNNLAGESRGVPSWEREYTRTSVSANRKEKNSIFLFIKINQNKKERKKLI